VGHVTQLASECVNGKGVFVNLGEKGGMSNIAVSKHRLEIRYPLPFRFVGRSRIAGGSLGFDEFGVFRAAATVGEFGLGRRQLTLGCRFAFDLAGVAGSGCFVSESPSAGFEFLVTDVYACGHWSSPSSGL
jgi:hypothetical protein